MERVVRETPLGEAEVSPEAVCKPRNLLSKTRSSERKRIANSQLPGSEKYNHGLRKRLFNGPLKERSGADISPPIENSSWNSNGGNCDGKKVDDGNSAEDTRKRRSSDSSFLELREYKNRNEGFMKNRTAMELLRSYISPQDHPETKIQQTARPQKKSLGPLRGKEPICQARRRPLRADISKEHHRRTERSSETNSLGNASDLQELK